MALPTDPLPSSDTDEVMEDFDAGVAGELTRLETGDRSPNDLGDRPAPYLPTPSDHLDIGIGVLQDLLRVEQRTNRVRRILRIWESKVAAAIRSRDMNAAEAWMRAVTGDTGIPEGHAEAVQSAAAALSRPALIDDLIVWVVNADALDDAAGLLVEWGEPVVRRMVDLMAVDDPPVNRRHMIDVLTVIGRSDSRLLTAYVGDHRWFIVRNIAIALGRSGRLATIPALHSLTDHEDARVRVEALRGLAAIDGDAALGDLIGAFHDGDRRVRQVAVSLLRACANPEVATRLAGVLRSGKLATAESERLVEVIGERKDVSTQGILEALASQRGRRGVSKAIRLAAKRELARRAQ
jgi:hypothetical protein